MCLLTVVTPFSHYIYELTRPASNIVCAMPKNLFKSRLWYQMATKELLSRDILLLSPTHNFRAAYVFFCNYLFHMYAIIIHIKRPYLQSETQDVSCHDNKEIDMSYQFLEIKKCITMHINKKIQVSWDAMVYHSTLDVNIQHTTN